MEIPTKRSTSITTRAEDTSPLYYKHNNYKNPDALCPTGHVVH